MTGGSNAALAPVRPAGPATNGLSGAAAPPDLPPLIEQATCSAAPGPEKLAAPISDALNRITLKPFGIEVSPGHSPVSPERFSGYHTGVDFETTPEEALIDVPVHAICTGPLALKESAGGYGGVALQNCRIDGGDATVVYGHLRLTSVAAEAGQVIQAGDVLGVLGTGSSRETDGERKHLHLGIHRGKQANIRGYVARQDGLNDWIDVVPMLESK